jgi:hypothetical protein
MLILLLDPLGVLVSLEGAGIHKAWVKGRVAAATAAARMEDRTLEGREISTSV